MKNSRIKLLIYRHCFQSFGKLTSTVKLSFNIHSLASRVQHPASSFQRRASRVQRQESSVQRPESRVQCPESSVHSPAFRAQRPILTSRVREFRYAEKETGNSKAFCFTSKCNKKLVTTEAFVF